MFAEEIKYVKSKNDADLVVYVTKDKWEADHLVWTTTSTLYARGHCYKWYIRTWWTPGVKKVYITKFINDADMKIHFVSHEWEVR